MFSHVTFALWGCTTALKLILVCFAWRGNYRPFTAYIGFSLAKSSALWLLALSNHWDAYTLLYNFGGFAENVLLAGVVLHLAFLMFFPSETLPCSVFRTSTFTLYFLLAGTLLSAICFQQRYPALWRTIERTTFWALLEALVVAICLARFLNIPWRSRATWIALGLFCYLAVSTINPSPLAYLLAELTWLAGFLVPETKAVFISKAEILSAIGVMEELLPPKKSAVSEREQNAKGEAA